MLYLGVKGEIERHHGLKNAGGNRHHAKCLAEIETKIYSNIFNSAFSLSCTMLPSISSFYLRVSALLDFTKKCHRAELDLSHRISRCFYIDSCFTVPQS